MRLILMTALTMIAFAANSLLNRWGVGPGHIGAVEFALIRLLAGAVTLAGLVLWLRGGWAWPGRRGRVSGVLGLASYLIGFSLAYRGLDAGTGALVLFGTVQVTMFAGALMSREPVPGRRWAGAALALGGLALIAVPGKAGLGAEGLGPMVTGRRTRWQRRRGTFCWRCPWCCRWLCWGCTGRMPKGLRWRLCRGR